MTLAGGHEPPPDDALVPARILNEHVYCPRLAWLEWEAKAFVDNLETVEGRDVHRRVDEERGGTPEPPSGDPPEGDAADDSEHVDDANAHRPRSVTALPISSSRLGVTAKLDRVDFRDGQAIRSRRSAAAPAEEDLSSGSPSAPS
ncbi:CRISPR-associated protein Cas4 [Patulibacter defluvii]|uniref:CRISPR-associated protein Cas4 n=1 Tax=Patulibacter defluvii TaxID=3095358 RepID=UPI002A752835|nr:hypothetical protein [Patulibacter sp. DM4]